MRKPSDHNQDNQSGLGGERQEQQGPAVKQEEPVNEAGAGQPVSAQEFEALSAKLKEAETELAELNDKYLRALADSENARKRIRQQGEEAARIQRENMLRELLPIVDNLERAVGAAQGGGNGKPIVEGVEMVLRSILDFLRSQGVTPLEASGRQFDPQLHEAVDHVETADHEPNAVVEVFNKGYQIGERMLRPARVSVAKAASPKDDE